MDIRDAVSEKHLRPILRNLLSQCTERQQTFFKRAFGSVDDTSAEKIPSAIALCERTIKKNLGAT